jgi:tetratricopeptide (TPR) repeat protein
VLKIVKAYYVDKLDGKYKLLLNITRDIILENLKSLTDKIERNLKDKTQTVTINSASYLSGYFVGRKDKIAEIKKHINKDKKILLISGIGGIGKSEICKKLFHEYKNQSNKKIKHIGWIDWKGDFKSSFFDNFLATKEIQDVNERFEKTKEYINTLKGSLLLFIDNMNEIIEEDKKTLGNLGGNIVITSRLNEIGNIQRVKIRELSENDCIEIYNKILERNAACKNEIVCQIVEKAARLTLVVELLAKTARASKLTDDKLLEELNKHRFNLADIKEKIANSEGDEKTFNEHLKKLFDISKIKENEAEFNILKKFSLFPQIPLEFETTKRWLEQKDYNLLNNLVKKGWLIEETGRGFYMHQVISDVVRYEDKPSYEECIYLVDMMNKDLYVDVSETFKKEFVDKFSGRVGILPFSEKVVEYFENEKNENIADLLHNSAKFYYWQADYKKALDFFDKALAIRNTAATYNGIAKVYLDQNNYGKALEYYEYALEIIKQALFKEHPDTANYNDAATAYNDMAKIYSEQYKYDCALDYYDKALEARIEAFGEKHPYIAIIYSNIGQVYHKQGKNDKALEYHDKALAIIDKIDELNKEGFDTEHPTIGTAYNNIARFHFDKGNYNEALEYYYKALKIREKRSMEHPSTAATYNSIAEVHSIQSEYAKALELYLKSYKIFNKFDASHPNSKKCKQDMEKAYAALGKAAEFDVWLGEQLNSPPNTGESL